MQIPNVQEQVRQLLKKISVFLDVGHSVRHWFPCPILGFQGTCIGVVISKGFGNRHN